MTKDKIKVVLSGIFYPVAMLDYFWKALDRRDDIDLITVGPYTGQYIPWGGGMKLPAKYAISPTIPLDPGLIPLGKLDPRVVQSQLPWTPDLWLQVDAGWYFTKPSAKIVAHVATDPHCLSYDSQRQQSDIFFCMQTPYMQPGDKYLPYAYDPLIHYPMPELQKEYDVCLIGLHYEQRTRLVNALRAKGLKVYYDIGPAFDENRVLYNQSKVAISWSSLNDLPTRVFEAMGMKIPLVANVVPDMDRFFEKEVDYLPFSTVEHGVSQVMRLIEDVNLRDTLANNAHEVVKTNHTWDARIQEILEVCNLQ